MSNVFDVASRSQPYERVVVAKNLQYAIETVRAEGASPWFTAAHDETALCLEGEIEISLVQPVAPLLDAGAEGAHVLEAHPAGRRMGRIILRRGHQALLPAKAAYRFSAMTPGVLIIQTLLGPASVQRWAEICQTEA